MASFSRAAKGHWPQESQLRNCLDQADLLRVAEEKLQPGVVFAVEIVVDVLREVYSDLLLRDPQFRRPFRCNRRNVLGQQSVIARPLESTSQIHCRRLAMQGIQPHRPEREY